MRLLAETEEFFQEYAAKELSLILSKEVLKHEYLKNMVTVNTDTLTRDLVLITFFSHSIYRFYLEVAELIVESPNDMYRKALEINWHEFWDPSQTFAIRPFTEKRAIERDIGVKVGQAIVDAFLKETGKRPKVRLENPDIEIMAWLKDEKLLLGINMCGEPLNDPEILFARNLLFISNWDEKSDLAEVFCDGVAISALRLAVRDPHREKILKRTFIKTKIVNKEEILELMRTNWRRNLGELTINCYERANRIEIVKQENPEIRKVGIRRLEDLRISTEKYILSNTFFVIEKKSEEKEWLDKIFNLLKNNDSWETMCVCALSEAFPQDYIGEKLYELNIKFKGKSGKIVCLSNNR
ncbi:MAG: THUMP domain-containing protein [Candidatus Njordarchaeales archaeon]